MYFDTMIVKIIKMSIGHYRYTTLYTKSDVKILRTVLSLHVFIYFLVFHYMFRPHMGHHQVYSTLCGDHCTVLVLRAPFIHVKV
jgi:uncharacterized protein (DUF486 family)